MIRDDQPGPARRGPQRPVEATVDPGLLNRNMVLQNSVLFGSVNANRDHYELAAQALAQADPGWLAGRVTRRLAAITSSG